MPEDRRTSRRNGNTININLTRIWAPIAVSSNILQRMG
jgi:hypothetical protein